MIDVSGEPTIVRLSLVVGAGALGATLAFLLTAFAIRGVLVRQVRRRKAVEAAWMPAMLRSMREETASAPPLRRRDWGIVLALWNRLTAGIEGEAVERLGAFARQAGLVDAGRALVRRGSSAELVLAATFLGRNRDVAGVKVLLRLTEEAPLSVRAEAARALVRIDPTSGVRAVAPMIARWGDCHAAVAVAILRDAPPHVVSEHVAAEALSAEDPGVQSRLVDVLASIKGPAGHEAARTLLDRRPASEVASRCLAVLREHRHPDDAPRVRPYLTHEASFVRVQAVAALARLQRAGDVWRIAGCLDDADWWVRNRAAQAVIKSAAIPLPLAELLAAIHPDRYARGALAQVLSERRLSS